MNIHDYFQVANGRILVNFSFNVFHKLSRMAISISPLIMIWNVALYQRMFPQFTILSDWGFIDTIFLTFKIDPVIVIHLHSLPTSCGMVSSKITKPPINWLNPYIACFDVRPPWSYREIRNSICAIYFQVHYLIIVLNA